MWKCFMATVLATAAGMASVTTPEDQMFDGKVVSVATQALTVSDAAGQILQTFDIPESTKITLNGKPAVLMELMMGDAVKITLSGAKIKAVEAVRSIKVATTSVSEPTL